MQKFNSNRRQAIKSVVTWGGLGGFMVGKLGLASLASACGLTPPQTEGPFYPEKDQEDKDWDLVNRKPLIVNGIYGSVILVSGTVMDEACAPVKNALVEIWQACATGRYNHSGDDSGLKLDPNFQYWGRSTTDAQGKYLFKTILPGHYPASSTWERPPHIHFKVYARGFHDLTSQMYFSGKSFGGAEGELIDTLNRRDAILHGVPQGERERVIVSFLDSVEGQDKGMKRGNFDITLKKV